MRNILVSIIIPIYQVEQYIGECIDSVLSQTYRNLEVILVDDCTPDRSMEIARKQIEKSPFSQEMKFCYIRHDHNRGLSAARNTGIREANGDYLYFLDSDDSIDPKTIELLINSIGYSQMCIAGVRKYNVSNMSDVVEHILDDNLYKGHMSVANSLYNGKWYVMAWNKLVRRDFIIGNNLFFEEGIIHEDEIWSNILACVATSIVTISPVTYNYRQRTNSIVTGTGFEKRIYSWKEGIRCLSIYELNTPDDINMIAHKLIRRVCNRYLSLCLELGGFRSFCNLYKEICPIREICFKKVKPVGIDYLKEINYSLPTKCGCVLKYMSFKALRFRDKLHL